MPEPDSATVAAKYGEGLSLKDTAKALGISVHYVRQGLKREQVKIRSSAETMRLRAAQVLGGTNAAAEYASKGPGNGLDQVAIRYQVGRDLLKTWLSMQGVPLRDKAAAGRVRAAGMDPEARRAMVRPANRAWTGSVVSFEQRATTARSRQGKPGKVIRAAHRNLIAVLKADGRAPVMQQAIGPYNVSVGAGPRVAVELGSGGTAWSVNGDRGDRLRYLLGEGWDILFLRVMSAEFNLTQGAVATVLRLAGWRDEHPDEPARWVVIHRDGGILREGTLATMPQITRP
jgi:hypothetical protein